MKKFSNILWGLLFIVLGVMIGLNSFGVTNINFFFDGWWTLFIIIPSFIEFFRSKVKVLNVIGIATGVAILLFCQGIFSFEMLWKLALPTILVLIGVALVFKDAIFAPKSTPTRKRSDKKGQEDKYSTSFSSKSIKYDGQVFYGNDLSATFGNITCDLRNAIINEDIIINTNVTFGSIDILMPHGVNVEIKSSGIGGTYDNRHSSYINGAPTVFVSSMCLLGNVEIK